jgi:hypothetical protein
VPSRGIVAQRLGLDHRDLTTFGCISVDVLATKHGTDGEHWLSAVATRQSPAALLSAAGKPGQGIRATMNVEAKGCDKVSEKWSP